MPFPHTKRERESKRYILKAVLKRCTDFMSAVIRLENRIVVSGGSRVVYYTLNETCKEFSFSEEVNCADIGFCRTNRERVEGRGRGRAVCVLIREK